MQNLPKSVLKRLRETRPAAGSHPDADLLAAFAEQSLRERERSFVMEHLAACGDCREVIVLALPETATEIVRSPASVGAARGGWLTWPALRWVALAAGILVIVSVGVLRYSHRNPDSGIASNFMLKDAAPAPSNEPPSSKVATPEEDKQNEPLSAPRSHRLTAHEAASKAMDGTQPRGLAAYSGGSGGGRAPLGVPSRGETGSAAISENQLAQNRPDLPLLDRNLGNADVVKAKDPVAAQTAFGSSAALAPPAIPLEASRSLMLRVPSRWAISPAGALERSFDGGNTWAPVNPNMSATWVSEKSDSSGEPDKKKEAAPNFNPVFRAVAAAGLEVWAGTLAGALYHTSDGGNHWARVAPSEAGATITGDIVTIQFSDPQQGKVSTSTGELWTTFDGGQTWHKQP
jgi:Photosynthesis system II assembly factor YCF48